MADEIKTTAAEAPESRNFIHAFIEEDIAHCLQLIDCDT